MHDPGIKCTSLSDRYDREASFGAHESNLDHPGPSWTTNKTVKLQRVTLELRTAVLQDSSLKRGLSTNRDLGADRCAVSPPEDYVRRFYKNEPLEDESQLAPLVLQNHAARPSRWWWAGHLLHLGAERFSHHALHRGGGRAYIPVDR